MSESWDHSRGRDVENDQNGSDEEERNFPGNDNQRNSLQQNSTLDPAFIDPALQLSSQHPDPFQAGPSRSHPQQLHPTATYPGESSYVQASSGHPGPPPDQVTFNVARGNPNPIGYGPLRTVHEPLRPDASIPEQLRILSRYVDYGPQHPGEQDADYAVRLQRANMNIETGRRQLPSQWWQELPEDERAQHMLPFLRNLTNDWEEHRARITPGHWHYSEDYHRQFHAEKLTRKQKNAERRAFALQKRRDLEALDDLDPVPDPVSPLSSGDELYSWSIYAPFPAGYNPRDDLNQLEAENRNIEGQDNNRGGEDPRQSSKGKGKGKPQGKGKGKEKDPVGSSNEGMGAASRISKLFNDPNIPPPDLAPAFGGYPTFGMPASSAQLGFGGQIGVPLPNPLPNPHLGLPNRNILPDGYHWSDARCNNCGRHKTNCDAFRKKTKAETDAKIPKDMNEATISFPCRQCLKDPKLARTCTWGINKTGGRPRLFWTGQRTVRDPSAQDDDDDPKKDSRYRKYKIGYSVPFLEGQINVLPGDLSASASIEVQNSPPQSRTETSLPFGAAGLNLGPIYANTSLGGQRSSKVKGSRVATTGKITKPGESRPKKKPGPSKVFKRRCQTCVKLGKRPTAGCDIANKHPCSRCENMGKECIEDHTQPIGEAGVGLGEVSEGQRATPALSSVLHTLSLTKVPPASGAGRAAERATGSQVAVAGRGEIPSARSGNTKRTPGKSHKGGGGSTQREGLTSTQQQNISERPLQLQNMGGNFDYRNVEMSFDDDEDRNPNHGRCNTCIMRGLHCDGNMPCSHCQTSGLSCDRNEGQTYEAQPRPTLPGSATNANATESEPRPSHGPMYQLLLTMLSDDEEEDEDDTTDLYGQNIDPSLRNSQYDAATLLERQNEAEISPELQPFARIRNQNAQQLLTEGNIGSEQRSLNVLGQSFILDRENRPIRPDQGNAEPYFEPFPAPTMTNSDENIPTTEALNTPPGMTRNIPYGPVFPSIPIPPERAWPVGQIYDGDDGCHEIDARGMTLGEYTRCRKLPTQRCSVLGHTNFCICDSCREIQEYLVVETAEGPKMEPHVIEEAKAYCCIDCAQSLRSEARLGNGSQIIQNGNCLCSGQLSMLCLCSAHRVQAMELVVRRTMLIDDHVTRVLSGAAFPCAYCEQNSPNPNSGAWQCKACGDIVVGENRRFSVF